MALNSESTHKSTIFTLTYKTSSRASIMFNSHKHKRCKSHTLFLVRKSYSLSIMQITCITSKLHLHSNTLVNHILKEGSQTKSTHRINLVNGKVLVSYHTQRIIIGCKLAILTKINLFDTISSWLKLYSITICLVRLW